MKLLSLDLTNFKRHKVLQITFADNLNVIRGPNWAGKSSVLHGVLFALFGVSAIPGKKEDLQTWGGGPLSVTLTTDKGQITRTLANATVVLPDDSVKATGHSSVDLWVTQQFGLDKKTLLELLYSPQSETSAILTLGVPALNRLVERLSGADLAERAIQASTRKLGRVDAALDNLGTEPLVPERPVCPQDTREALRAERVAAQQMQANARENHQQAQQVHADAKRAASLREQIGELEPVVAPLPDEINQLEKTLTDAEVNNLSYFKKSELTQWFQTTGSLWESLEPNIEKSDKLKIDIEAVDAAWSEAKSKTAVAQSKVQALKESISGAICQTCKRAFEDHDPEQLKAELKQAEDELQNCKANEAKEVYSFNLLKQELRGLELPPSDYEARYNEKSEQYNALAEVSFTDTTGLKTQLTELRQRDKAHGQYVSRLKVLQEQLDSIKVPVELPDMNLWTTAIQAHETMLAHLNEKLIQKEKEITQYENDLKEYNKMVAAGELYRTKYANLSRKSLQYREFIKWLKKFKTEALSGAWSNICSVASEFICEASGGRATELVREEDQFLLVEEGRAVPMAVVSGGMRAIAGTGLKLALSQLGFLILDEASSELNDANAANLAGALASSGKQVVLVTHRTGEEFIASQVLDLAQM